MCQVGTTFGGFCEYVQSGAKFLKASVNLCQMMHIFIAFCKYVFCLRQCMMNSGFQLNSIAYLGFQN